MNFAFRTHLIQQAFASNATSCCYVTKWVTVTTARMGQIPIQTGPPCPVQIRAHHHIDVYTDINDITIYHKYNTVKCVDISR